MDINKGYTGQYADPLSGFDYYNARYYDPVAGVFLSADTVQGNMQGMNPYAYVGGNPETYTDPTGNMYAPPGGGGTPPPSPPPCDFWCQLQNGWHGIEQTYQHALSNTVSDYKAAWNDEVHFAQQAQETIQAGTSAGFSVAYIIIGVAIAVAVGVGGYLIWHFTHRQALPAWSDLSANENVQHNRYVLDDKTGALKLIESRQHVLKDHVYLSKEGMIRKADRQRGDATVFYDADVAQWTVNYAIENMTNAQKKQLENMERNPRSGQELELTGTAPMNIGLGYKYFGRGEPLVYSETLRNYVVRIAVDASGNPFIVTAYPTF